MKLTGDISILYISYVSCKTTSLHIDLYIFQFGVSSFFAHRFNWRFVFWSLARPIFQSAVRLNLSHAAVFHVQFSSS